MGRGTRLGQCVLGLVLAISISATALAQMGGGGGGGGGGRRGGGQGDQNPQSSPDSTARRGMDPESHDAIDLYSHLCVSTYGDLGRATAIIGEGDSAVEKMDAPMLRGLEDGKSGGTGWLIRMPLGEKLLLEFPPGGACIVRAPRVDPAQLETAFRNLLDQYASSSQFAVRRIGDQTKTIDAEIRRGPDQPPVKEKVKFHIVTYSMTLPNTGKTAILGLASTVTKDVPIQATLSFETSSANSLNAQP